MGKFKLISEISVILILSLGALFFVSVYVPFNMDEFAAYPALAYWYYPLNRLNAFTESYHGYDLAPFGGTFYLPLRSYQYIGSLPGLLYYPLFRLWPSPYSARLLGLVILAVQAFFVYKIFKVNPLISFILLLSYMPYAFQHVIDKGPAALHITSVFFICYIMPKWLSSLKRDSRFSVVYPLIIGIILFLGIWIKLAYLFMLPGIVGLMAYYIVSEKDAFTAADNSRLNRLAQQVLILFCTAGIPAFILLNSFDRFGYRYYGYFIYSNQNPINRDFKNLLAHFYSLSRYLTNPLTTANNIFMVDKQMTAAGIVMTAALIILLGYGIRQCRLKKIKSAFPVLNMSLFLLTFLLLTMSARTRYMHHVVLSFPFLVLALFYIGSKLYKNAVVAMLIIIFLMANYVSYYDLTRLKPTAYDHPSKLKLNNLLNRYANEYVFILIDWGLFYMKALYGDKNQCVIYFLPFSNASHAAQAKGVLRKTGRKAMFIGLTHSISNLPLMRKEFPGLVELKTNFDTGDWRVWHER